MKILHVLNSNRFSGAENVVCQIIGMFHSDGETDMAYCSPDGTIREKLQQKGITFFPVKKLTRKSLSRVIKQFHPDIIHAHDFRASVLATFLRFKGKIISHLHNNDPKMKSVSVKSVLYTSRIYKMDVVLGVSQSILEESRFKKGLTAKFVMIGNPIDVQMIRKGSTGGPKLYDIAFVGRLCAQKDPLRFIRIVGQIAKRDKSVKCIMVGDGEMRNELEKTIADLGLSENIRLLGFRSNVYDLIDCSRLLVMTSRWEGFGLVAVEAMAFGVPVAATPVGGLSSLINHEAGRLCYDNEGFVNFYFELHDENTYARYRKGAYLRADELDNIESYKNRLLDIYRS